MRQRFRTQQAFQSCHNAYTPDHRSYHRHNYFTHAKSIFTSRQAQSVQTNQQIKEKLYHKNFSQFKQIFQSQTNTQALPFIMALRQTKLRMNDPNPNQITVLQPFEVSGKKTINQSTKKDVSSIQANRMRAFQASYRWKKRSGRDVRVSCQFQSKLRESSQQKRQQQSSFVNYIKPIRYKAIESKRYNLKDIICEHQKKIFNLEGNT